MGVKLPREILNMVARVGVTFLFPVLQCMGLCRPGQPRNGGKEGRGERQQAVGARVLGGVPGHGAGDTGHLSPPKESGARENRLEAGRSQLAAPPLQAGASLWRCLDRGHKASGWPSQDSCWPWGATGELGGGSRLPASRAARAGRVRHGSGESGAGGLGREQHGKGFGISHDTWGESGAAGW